MDFASRFASTSLAASSAGVRSDLVRFPNPLALPRASESENLTTQLQAQRQLRRCRKQILRDLCESDLSRHQNGVSGLDTYISWDQNALYLPNLLRSIAQKKTFSQRILKKFNHLKS